MDLKKHYGEESVLQKLDGMPSQSRLQKRKKGIFTLRAVFFSLLGAGFIALCLGAGAYRGIIADAPDVSEINIGPTQYATFVYDVQGNQIQQINELKSYYALQVRGGGGQDGLDLLFRTLEGMAKQ